MHIYNLLYAREISLIVVLYLSFISDIILQQITCATWLITYSRKCCFEDRMHSVAMDAMKEEAGKQAAY